jgi:hypothetical protein
VDNPHKETPEETDVEDDDLDNDSWSSWQLLQDGVYHFFSYDNAMTLRQFESRLERYGTYKNTQILAEEKW